MRGPELRNIGVKLVQGLDPLLCFLHHALKLSRVSACTTTSPRWPPSKLGARFFHRDELEALNGSGRPRQPDAHSCPQYIGDLNCQITDAEIAFRESVVDRSVGPQPLNCATLRRPNCQTQPEAFTPAWLANRSRSYSLLRRHRDPL